MIVLLGLCLQPTHFLRVSLNLLVRNSGTHHGARTSLTKVCSYAMTIFWVVVVAIGLLNRIFGILGRLVSRRRPGWTPVPLGEIGEDGNPIGRDPEKKRNLPSTWWKRYIALPATFGYRTSQPFGWYTVPPRIQSLTIFAFVLLNVVFCAYGYRVFPGNM